MAEVPPFLWADAGTFDSPHIYTVPGSGEVQPYTATATYDNQSGQAILPALRLKSSSGNLLGLVFPSTTIADGDSQEVSFVPPFGSAAVSATPATGGTDFGNASYDWPLVAAASSGNWLHTTSVVWVFDAAVSSGGYLTKVTPANGSYFALWLNVHPQNAIYAFSFTYASGTDYGKFDVNLASALYQSSLRSPGDPEGKLQDLTIIGSNPIGAGYGAAPSFKNLATYDAYSAVAIAESGSSGVLTFIPGGAEGAVLTNLSATTDPYTGLGISNGGPGWYLLQFKVNGKNAASTNFRFRIISVQVLRTPDATDF